MAIRGHSRAFAFKKRKKIADNCCSIADNCCLKIIRAINNYFWIIPGQFLVIPVKKKLVIPVKKNLVIPVKTKHQRPTKVHSNSILTFTKFHLGKQ